MNLRVIALHPCFVNLHMPQKASLDLLISKPIRANVFFFVIYKRGNSQYSKQALILFTSLQPCPDIQYQTESSIVANHQFFIASNVVVCSLTLHILIYRSYCSRSLSFPLVSSMWCSIAISNQNQQSRKYDVIVVFP